MFLFWRLLVAHLVSDFPLQTGWIFKEKTEHSWGVVYHGSVAGILGLAFSWPYLRSPKAWLILLLLWLFHIAVDKGKIVLNARAARIRWLIFVIDQSIHVGLVWIAATMIGGPALGASVPIYGSNRFFELASAYLVSTYAVLFLVSSIKGSRPGAAIALPRPSLRLVEFGERLAITVLTALPGYLFCIAPFCLLPRIFLKRFWPGEISYWELPLSLVLSAAVGILIREVLMPGHFS
jgi:hypothetical protein